MYFLLNQYNEGDFPLCLACLPYRYKPNYTANSHDLTTITSCWRWFWDIVFDNLFIVSINDTSKVRHGTITDFYIIPIKDFI